MGSFATSENCAFRRNLLLENGILRSPFGVCVFWCISQVFKTVPNTITSHCTRTRPQHALAMVWKELFSYSFHFSLFNIYWFSFFKKCVRCVLKVNGLVYPWLLGSFVECSRWIYKRHSKLWVFFCDFAVMLGNNCENCEIWRKATTYTAPQKQKKSHNTRPFCWSYHYHKNAGIAQALWSWFFLINWVLLQTQTITLCLWKSSTFDKSPLFPRVSCGFLRVLQTSIGPVVETAISQEVKLDP